MFLVGGPAFSGTTLLSLLLNQGDILCLDEPDFHNPEQSHRGIPFLKTLFPGKVFPDRPYEQLSYADAVSLIETCERMIQPMVLGVKTCDEIFIDYAKVYKAKGYPVIAIIRDIRDALVRPLPPWLDEAGLNHAYRLIWNHLDSFDAWFRYEELVANPAPIFQKIGTILDRPLRAIDRWAPEAVHAPMLKLDRHDLLKSGALSSHRIGIWKTSGIRFASQTTQTAAIMGY